MTSGQSVACPIFKGTFTPLFDNFNDRHSSSNLYVIIWICVFFKLKKNSIKASFLIDLISFNAFFTAMIHWKSKWHFIFYIAMGYSLNSVPGNVFVNHQMVEIIKPQSNKYYESMIIRHHRGKCDNLDPDEMRKFSSSVLLGD